MKIALIGYYGHGNAGDERILYCLRRYFTGHDLLVVNGFAGLERHLADVNRCDLVLFGGGGVIQRGTGIHASKFERIVPPLACLGISVEAIHRDNQELVDVLSHKCRFILVRDKESARVFRSTNVVVGPDLTFLFPYPVASSQDKGVCAVNLLPWHYWAGTYKGAWFRLMKRLDRRLPFVRSWYPLPRWQPSEAIRILAESFQDLRPLPMQHNEPRISDRDVLSPYFADVPTVFDPVHLANCEFLVSMRLHGAIFACQMAVPFISLCYQPKNRNFCRSIDLQDYAVSIFQLGKLPKTAAMLKTQKAFLRRHLQERREEMHREIRRVMLELIPTRTGTGKFA